MNQGWFTSWFNISPGYLNLPQKHPPSHINFTPDLWSLHFKKASTIYKRLETIQLLVARYQPVKTNVLGEAYYQPLSERGQGAMMDKLVQNQEP